MAEESEMHKEIMAELSSIKKQLNTLLDRTNSHATILEGNTSLIRILTDEMRMLKSEVHHLPERIAEETDQLYAPMLNDHEERLRRIEGNNTPVRVD